MKKHKITFLLAAFVLTASFGYAQNTTKQIVQTPKDSTISREKPIPAPTIYIGNNLQGGKVPKEDLLENPFLTITGTEWNIVSYKVTFVKVINGNGVEDAPIFVKGTYFTDKVISKIKSYPARTVVEFSDIKIQSSAGIKTVATVLMIRIE
jgi:hypothetical protein